MFPDSFADNDRQNLSWYREVGIYLMILKTWSVPTPLSLIIRYTNSSIHDGSSKRSLLALHERNNIVSPKMEAWNKSKHFWDRYSNSMSQFLINFEAICVTAGIQRGQNVAISGIVSYINSHKPSAAERSLQKTKCREQYSRAASNWENYKI